MKTRLPKENLGIPAGKVETVQKTDALITHRYGLSTDKQRYIANEFARWEVAKVNVGTILKPKMISKLVPTDKSYVYKIRRGPGGIDNRNYQPVPLVLQRQMK